MSDILSQLTRGFVCLRQRVREGSGATGRSEMVSSLKTAKPKPASVDCFFSEKQRGGLGILYMCIERETIEKARRWALGAFDFCETCRLGG